MSLTGFEKEFYMNIRKIAIELQEIKEELKETNRINKTIAGIN
jgi:hypothetical protein